MPPGRLGAGGSIRASVIIYEKYCEGLHQEFKRHLGNKNGTLDKNSMLGLEGRQM